MTLLRIPIDPHPQARPRVVTKRRKDGTTYIVAYTDPPTRKHQAAVRLYLSNHWTDTITSGKVVVSMQFFPTRQRGDLDNYVKLVLDACNGVVWKDDRQLKELHSFIDPGGAGFTMLEVVTDDGR